MDTMNSSEVLCIALKHKEGVMSLTKKIYVFDVSLMHKLMCGYLLSGTE